MGCAYPNPNKPPKQHPLPKTSIIQSQTKPNTPSSQIHIDQPQFIPQQNDNEMYIRDQMELENLPDSIVVSVNDKEGGEMQRKIGFISTNIRGQKPQLEIIQQMSSYKQKSTPINNPSSARIFNFSVNQNNSQLSNKTNKTNKKDSYYSNRVPEDEFFQCLQTTIMNLESQLIVDVRLF